MMDELLHETVTKILQVGFNGSEPNIGGKIYKILEELVKQKVTQTENFTK